MKKLLKTLLYGILFLVIIGFCFCVYILQAPPVAEPEPPKLQVHTRTALRGRPTVNSKPIVYTRDIYRFSIDKKYISNLNIGEFSRELLFSVVLGQRSRYSPELLDKELKTVFNWQKMFANSAKEVQFSSGKSTVKVILSGQDWFVTDKTGAGYAVQKNENQLDIYLPNLLEAFDNNGITLSADIESSIEKVGTQWLIKDKNARQAYEIRNSNKELKIYQQSKYPIQTFLFTVDLASEDSLSSGTFSKELREGFANQNIPLSRKAKLIAGKDDASWRITDGFQKYVIRNENARLRVYLDLESKWLFVQAKGQKGWLQRERGTLFSPLEPTLSSRQQLKEKMVVLIEKIKEKVGTSKESDQVKKTELP